MNKMNDIGWITDPHLSFLKSPKKKGETIKEKYSEVDKWIITGDIAEGINFKRCLTEFQKGLGSEIYFVAGNHDYYHSSFDEMNTVMKSKMDGITWLRHNTIDLGNDTYLIGNGGWYDGRCGNTQTSVLLNDFRLIYELYPAMFNRDLLLELCRAQADVLSVLLYNQAIDVLKHGAKRIVIATHVPPFEEACWHEGRLSGRDWTPWFVSVAMGDAIHKLAERNLNVDFIVLCGHTHSSGKYQHADNCVVHTGMGEYNKTMVSGLIDLNKFEVKI